jgi:TonB-dependent receptor
VGVSVTLTGLLWLVSTAFAGDGALTGLLLDGDRARPIAGATVRVDLETGEDPLATTADDGAFWLAVPEGSWKLVVTLRSGASQTVGPFRFEADATTEVLVSWLAAWPPVVSAEEPPATTRAAPVDQGPLVTLIGRVRGEDGRPVEGARVYARGQAVEAITDAAGDFALQVPAGTWDLTVLRAGFATRTLPAVPASETPAEPLEVTLLPAGMELDRFAVTAPRVEGGTASLLDERREATGVTELLGAEQMKKSGDSNAAAALRRVTGLTVVGGRFVFIRGLGGRYSATLLNGSTLPSPEPEQRAVPLDLFPTGVLESVRIEKTFSPDRTAEFGGGLVQIRTRSVPRDPILQISGSMAMTTGVTFRSVASGYRSPTDPLTFGAHARAMPDEVTALGDQPVVGRGLLNPEGLDDAQLATIGEGFNNRWATDPRTVLPDGALRFAWGDSWQVGGERGPRVGALLSLNWSSGSGVDDAVRNVYSVANGTTNLQRATTYTELSQRAQLGGMAVLGASWGERHELAWTTFVNRIGDSRVGTYFQDDPTSASDRRQTESLWSEQQLVYTQLRGEHTLTERYPAVIDWRYVFSEATRLEPEQLRHTYALGFDGTYFASPTGTWNEINYGDLVDRLHEGGFDLTLPFLLSRPQPGLVKLGGLVLQRDRSADLRRFGFNQVGNGLDTSLPMEALVTPENIGADGPDDDGYLEINELLVSTDDYRASQSLYAAYALTEVPIATRLRWMGGARLEASTQQVTTFQLFREDEPPIETTLRTIDVLPATNLTVDIGPKDKPNTMLLRASYGRTLSRPEFRELAPVSYIEPTTGVVVFGNAGLQRALIDNVDLRWEWYFRPGESVSVAAFYKSFQDPIERVARPIAGSNVSQTLRNAAGATNFGAEVDFRLGWQGLHPWLRDVFVAGNASYIFSRIVLDDANAIDTNATRALQGQSPWVVNAQLGYDNPDLGLSIALLYNVFGPRITDVGEQGVPDTLELPVHRLDLVAIVPMPKGLQATLRASNLLDWPVQQRTGGEIAASMRDGVQFSFGLQWNR